VKRDALTIEGDQAVIADGDAIRIASEIPEDGEGAAEGRLDVDDPVVAKQRVDECVPRGRIAERGRGAPKSRSPRAYERRRPATNLPRNTRLRTFTGKKKPAHLGCTQRW
jgi:hypothetical protein